jgi:lysozyme family protein
MNPAFDNAFHRLMIYEGGYSNDPDDHGGETKYGISKTQYPDVDIRNLTIAQAKGIYRLDYWDKLNLDSVSDMMIAGEIFEQAVNFGPATAVKNLQDALNFLGAQLYIDGKLGPLTLAALNNYIDQRALQKALNGVQFEYYRKIVAMNPGQKKFARGWLRRVEI